MAALSFHWPLTEADYLTAYGLRLTYTMHQEGGLTLQKVANNTLDQQDVLSILETIWKG